MGRFADKSFFKEKLKDFQDKEYNFFEVAPAPDCCDQCKEKANKKIVISQAKEDDIPPFHDECRCDILPLEDDEEAIFLKRIGRPED